LGGEAGGCKVPVQPGLHRETLSQKKKKRGRMKEKEEKGGR
jgi:hypothetical protein